MKRLLIFIPILALLLLPMGCIEGVINSRFNALIQDATGNYTIKVGGTVGLNFTGEYEVWLLHFKPDTQSLVSTKESYIVQGQVPVEYTLKCFATAVIFQKQTGDYSLLSVEIWSDGVLLNRRETTDPWGAVWSISKTE
jgi:hypothetical protein